MRISNRILGIIKLSINKSYGNVPLYLFGSRVNDKKRGGDIDIAVDCNMSQKEFNKNKIKFISSMVSLGYDLKIDLVKYNNTDKLLSDEIKRTSILIWRTINAHKRGLIDSVDELRIIKDIRNTIVHEYIEDNLKEVFSEVLHYSDKLVVIMNSTKTYIDKLL